MKTYTVARRVLIGSAAFLLACHTSLADNANADDLAKEIFDTMLRVPGVHGGSRPVHAKGIVCQGTFQPSSEAAALSKAAHFQASTPLTIRFSDGATDPLIPDNSGNAGPRGMAIRFMLPSGARADIVAMSHNGFVVGTGEEFLALQKAVVATDPARPHPWPVEIFLGSHPRAMKFVTENAAVPASFASEAFFGNDAFIFVNSGGAKRAGRYQILPLAGRHDLTPGEARTRLPDFLIDDLKARLAKESVKYHLVVQLPNDGDRTDDASLVWPDDRKTIDMGTISITSIVADSDKAQRALAFDPTNLTDGIELSDDPLPTLRSDVYTLSAKYRRQHQK